MHFETLQDEVKPELPFFENEPSEAEKIDERNSKDTNTIKCEVDNQASISIKTESPENEYWPANVPKKAEFSQNMLSYDNSSNNVCNIQYFEIKKEDNDPELSEGEECIKDVNENPLLTSIEHFNPGFTTNNYSNYPTFNGNTNGFLSTNWQQFTSSNYLQNNDVEIPSNTSLLLPTTLNEIPKKIKNKNTALNFECENCKKGFNSENGIKKHTSIVQTCKEYYKKVYGTKEEELEENDVKLSAKKTYYKRNRDRVIQRNREYYQRNAERVRAKRLQQYRDKQMAKSIRPNVPFVEDISGKDECNIEIKEELDTNKTQGRH